MGARRQYVSALSRERRFFEIFEGCVSVIVIGSLSYVSKERCGIAKNWFLKMITVIYHQLEPADFGLSDNTEITNYPFTARRQPRSPYIRVERYTRVRGMSLVPSVATRSAFVPYCLCYRVRIYVTLLNVKPEYCGSLVESMVRSAGRIRSVFGLVGSLNST